jgi:hypothetical protein
MSAKTTCMRIIHATSTVDKRGICQRANAGFFSFDELPSLATQRVHLAGVQTWEFDMGFARGLKKRDHHLSADMQGFVRQVRADMGCGGTAFTGDLLRRLNHDQRFA